MDTMKDAIAMRKKLQALKQLYMTAIALGGVALVLLVVGFFVGFTQSFLLFAASFFGMHLAVLVGGIVKFRFEERFSSDAIEKMLLKKMKLEGTQNKPGPRR